MAKTRDIPDIIGLERQRIDVMGDVLSGKPVTARELIPLKKVRVDGGTQMRAGLNEATVEEYQEEFLRHKAWGDFPPVLLFYDGTDYWVADGFHRIEAFKRLWGDSNPSNVVHAEVRAGSRRDAILSAAGANASHGLRRTNADKRRAVETMLRDEEWAHWSDGEIARRCAVSQPFVSNVRRDLASTQNGFESTTRTGADGRTIDTSKIGSNQPQRKTLDSSVPAVAVVASEATHSRQQGAQLTTCRICHRPLSDPASAANGIGPCCAGKQTTAAGSGVDDDDDDDQPLTLDTVEDDDLDILTPDRHEPSSAAQKRNERIDSVLRRLYAVRSAASEFEELTGIYTHRPAFERVMDAMIGTLEANRV